MAQRFIPKAKEGYNEAISSLHASESPYKSWDEMERTIIQVAPHPLTNIFPDYDVAAAKDAGNIPYSGGWNVRLTAQLMRESTEYAYECWGMEHVKKELTWEKDGVAYRVFPCRSLRYIGNFSKALVHEAKRQAVRKHLLLHIHELFSYTTYVTPLVVAHTPIVVQHHGSWSALQQARRSPTTVLKLEYATLYGINGEWLFERTAFPKIDHIFVLNRPVAEYVARFVPKDRIEYLSMGIDFDHFVKRDKQNARRALGLKTDTRYILYIGSFVRVKGIPYLINALPEIFERCPNAVLILVGTGYYREHIAKLVRELGVEKGVLFFPTDNRGVRVDDDALSLYYNAADVVVLPSLSEGLAVVGMEALASETPLVATNVGGMSDLVDVFHAGTLIPPRSPEAIARAVLEYLGSAGEFQVDRENAKRRYAWKHIAQRTIEVYDDLFNTYY